MLFRSLVEEVGLRRCLYREFLPSLVVHHKITRIPRSSSLPSVSRLGSECTRRTTPTQAPPSSRSESSTRSRQESSSTLDWSSFSTTTYALLFPLRRIEAHPASQFMLGELATAKTSRAVAAVLVVLAGTLCMVRCSSSSFPS